MKILGITAAAKNIGVSFADQGKVLAEFSLSGKNVHSEDLVLLIDRISKESGTTLSEIEGIAVAKGPGSYGGLRGSVTTAKTLAQVHNIPVVGLPTLEVIAYSYRHILGTLLVLLNACRQDYNAALFACRQGEIERLTEDMVLTEARIKELIGEIKGELYVAGDISEQIPANIKAFTLDAISPASVALLGEKKLMTGEKDDLFELVPVYSHSPKFKEHSW